MLFSKLPFPAILFFIENYITQTFKMIDTNRHVRHFARHSPSLLRQNSLKVALTKTFRMNEQPSSKMMFEGDWGCCPDEQVLKKHPKVVLQK